MKRIKGTYGGVEVDFTFEDEGPRKVLNELKAIHIAIMKQTSTLLMLAKIMNTGKRDAA